MHDFPMTADMIRLLSSFSKPRIFFPVMGPVPCSCACSGVKGAAGKKGGRKRGRAQHVTLRAAAKAAEQLQGSFALRLTDTAQLGVFALGALRPANHPLPSLPLSSSAAGQAHLLLVHQAWP